LFKQEKKIEQNNNKLLECRFDVLYPYQSSSSISSSIVVILLWLIKQH